MVKSGVAEGHKRHRQSRSPRAQPPSPRAALTTPDLPAAGRDGAPRAGRRGCHARRAASRRRTCEPSARLSACCFLCSALCLATSASTRFYFPPAMSSDSFPDRTDVPPLALPRSRWLRPAQYERARRGGARRPSKLRIKTARPSNPRGAASPMRGAGNAYSFTERLPASFRLLPASCRNARDLTAFL
jgi:hypothetical protein